MIKGIWERSEKIYYKTAKKAYKLVSIYENLFLHKMYDTNWSLQYCLLRSLCWRVNTQLAIRQAQTGATASQCSITGPTHRTCYTKNPWDATAFKLQSFRSHVVLPVFAQLFKTFLETTTLYNFLQFDLQNCTNLSLYNQYSRATWSDLERNCIRRNTSRCIVSLSASSKSITRCKKPTRFPSSLALPAFNKWIWPSVGKPINTPQLICSKYLMGQAIMTTIM